MFIVLTQVNGRRVRVNTDQISYYQLDTKAGKGSVVWVDHSALFVVEAPHVVDGLIATVQGREPKEEQKASDASRTMHDPNLPPPDSREWYPT